MRSSTRLSVRPFAFQDIGPALHLAVLFHRESWQREFNFDPRKVQELMENVLIHPDMAGFVLVKDGGLPVGYVAGVASEMYFGRDRNVSDMGLYIKPDYRDFFAARELIKHLENWAWQQPRVKEISLGISAGIAQPEIVRFYERLGYTKGYYGVSKKSR